MFYREKELMTFLFCQNKKKYIQLRYANYFFEVWIYFVLKVDNGQLKICLALFSSDLKYNVSILNRDFYYVGQSIKMSLYSQKNDVKNIVLNIHEK